MKLRHSLRLLALLVAFLAAGAFAAPAPTAPPPALTQTRINGTTYISLPAWVTASRLSSSWIKRNDTLLVTNNAASVRLIANSREAFANNIRVWLLFPLISRNGQLFISQLDATTTLRPLFFPARNNPGAKIRTICLDPGHGGKDPGYKVGSREEKDITLLLAYELREQLKNAGFRVVLTRATDTYVDLPGRPAAAKKTGSDLFICLHFNATAVGRGVVQGIETYALTPAGARSTAAAGQGDTGGSTTGNRNNDNNLLLASQIQQKVTQRLHAEDRGVRRARYWVLRDATMPAILIEGGFMTHPVEGRKIFDAGYRREMARAITQGILAYKQTVERPR